jgi:hypothetical protein
MTPRAMGIAGIAATAALLGGCQLLGDLGPPTIFIRAPDSFSILAESPGEINGIAFGNLDRIELTVDGQPAGRPREGETTASWALPMSSRLGEGIHRVRAVATGPAGTAADTAIFSIGTQPFSIGFVPEQLMVDRATVGDEPVPVLLGILGPPFGDGYEVRLFLEDAGGLTFDVFPFDALESTNGFFQGPTAPVETGQWVFIDLAIDAQTPVGEHQLVVRADGPVGTEPQRATLLVVIDRAAPPTQEVAAPRAPHVQTYRVMSRVTSSDTPGVGNRASANWRLAFECADGRCDAEVRNGGPRGGMDPFTARYVPGDEAYRFEAVQRLLGESCSEQRLIGQIVPQVWDARGPVRFRYRLDGVSRCSRSDLHVTWEGTGRRR